MPVGLTAKLLGCVAIATPWVGLAIAGADAEALGALAALTLAGMLALARAPLDVGHPPALTDALVRLEHGVSEARARAADELSRAQTAGRFREEFVSVARHELRTPLNAILGFSDVLLEGVDGPLTPRQREDVEAIRAAGEYLAELVHAVLAEWSPRSGTPLPLAYVDLQDSLRGVARLLEGQRGARPVAIRVDVPPGLRGPIADPRRLRQIVVNLGANALRATARGEVVLEAREEGDHVRITVRDTGAGIAPELLPHVFAPFTQGEGPEAASGAGLGLAIVRELVEWHGGVLELETKRGEGTRVSVWLPGRLG